MVILDEDVNQWTLGTITDILHEGYYETDTLEFKEELSIDNQRIARTSCAFANTNGGHIIIGISDDRTKDPNSRIAGLSKSDDNIVKIADQLKNIIPEIPLEKIQFQKSPIHLHNGKEIIIIHIQRSDFLHQFDDKFYKRIQGKNEAMPYEEIKNKFIISRRIKRALDILTADLTSIKHIFETNVKVDNEIIDTHLESVRLLDTDGIKFFLYNQSYLHDYKIQNRIMLLLLSISQMQLLRLAYNNVVKGRSKPKIGEVNKKTKEPSYEEQIAEELAQFSKEGLKTINEIMKLLNLKQSVDEEEQNKDQNTSSNPKII